MIARAARNPVPPPQIPGWQQAYSGKVRDLYVPSDGSRDLLLVVASDRISAFDAVLPTEIPGKGRILTQLSLWWFDELSDLVDNHVISTDVPSDVEGRAMICRRLDMYPVECVARGYLTGSGLAEYREHGSVCDIPLPDGLQEASPLPQPIFTPARKARDGEHDENISFDELIGVLGQRQAAELRDITLRVYGRAAELAAKRGILLADTKLEFGAAGPSEPVVLGDEVLTPDSSRFWHTAAWQEGSTPPSFDKQDVRDWLRDAWQPGSPAPPPLPEDVVAHTQQRYVEAYTRLTGRVSPL